MIASRRIEPTQSSVIGDQQTSWRDRAMPILIGVFFLLAALGPLVGASPGSATGGGDGNAIRQVNYIVLFGLAVWLSGALAHPRRLFAIPLGLTVVLAWCWLSMVWAIEPSIAVRRLILTTIIVWTVFIAVRAAGFEKSIAAWRATLLLILAAGYIAAVFVPSIGVHQQANVLDPELVGDWKGVVIEKNAAGALTAITAILFLFNASNIKPALRILIVIASLFFLYKTGSKTSFALFFAAAAVGGLYLLYDRRMRGLLIAGLLMLGPIVAFAMSGHWARLLAPFSDPHAFTGRVAIWQALQSYSRDHPMGSGYGSFWWIGPTTPIYEYGAGWVKKAPNGHSGYMDLLAQIGAPGLIMAVSVLLVWPLFRLLTSLNVSRDRGAMLIACLLFVIGHNVTETSMLDRDSVVGVVLLFVVALTGLECARRSEPVGRGVRPDRLRNPDGRG